VGWGTGHPEPVGLVLVELASNGHCLLLMGERRSVAGFFGGESSRANPARLDSCLLGLGRLFLRRLQQRQPPFIHTSLWLVAAAWSSARTASLVGCITANFQITAYLFTCGRCSVRLQHRCSADDPPLHSHRLCSCYGSQHRLQQQLTHELTKRIQAVCAIPTHLHPTHV